MKNHEEEKLAREWKENTASVNPLQSMYARLAVLEVMAVALSNRSGQKKGLTEDLDFFVSELSKSESLPKDLIKEITNAARSMQQTMNLN